MAKTYNVGDMVDHVCRCCGNIFQAGARSRKIACSPRCSDALKKQYDRDRALKVKSGEIVTARSCGNKPREVRRCSLCGSIMGSGHITFGVACRAIAAQNGKQAPAYVTIRPAEHKIMEVCGG